MGMLPSVGPFSGLQKAADNVDEKQINRVEAIISSMTKHERLHHEVINGNRRKRIARGSGNQRAGGQQSAAPVCADEENVQADREAELRQKNGRNEAAWSLDRGRC